MSIKRIKVNAQKRSPQLPTFASVLIVDDERFDRARIRRICNDLDFETHIVEAATLEDMGSALASDVFNLIFLDFNMPDGDGLLALNAIQLSEKNRSAAVIMVTGDDDIDVAIAAMTNGCSDFIKKEDVSLESVRRASINVLQKAALNKGIEDEASMRLHVEAVLDQFTRQCVEEFQPMLYNVMRQVRGLQTVRMDENKYTILVTKIEKSCERLFDFVADIEDSERKSAILVQTNMLEGGGIDGGHHGKSKAERASLFGRRAV